jgi:hypothetical protein
VQAFAAMRRASLVVVSCGLSLASFLLIIRRFIDDERQGRVIDFMCSAVFICLFGGLFKFTGFF